MALLDDTLAIERLVARYNHAIDSGDAEAWAGTFVADGVFQLAGRDPVVGREALCEFARGLAPSSMRHFVSNLLVDVDAGGETATLRAYLALIRDHGIAMTGAYKDTLRKVDGEWGFVRRLFTSDPRPEASPAQ